jgi:hypothetical protein
MELNVNTNLYDIRSNKALRKAFPKQWRDYCSIEDEWLTALDGIRWVNKRLRDGGLSLEQRENCEALKVATNSRATHLRQVRAFARELLQVAYAEL